MWYFFPGMWRALFNRDIIAGWGRKSKTDVYVLHYKTMEGGKLYFLFTDMPNQHQLGTLVSKLSNMNCVVGGSIDIEARKHYVVMEWEPFGSCEPAESLIGDIRLTVFEVLLGTWEPSYKMFDIMPSDLAGEVSRLSRENDRDWATELRLQMS